MFRDSVEVYGDCEVITLSLAFDQKAMLLRKVNIFPNIAPMDGK